MNYCTLCDEEFIDVDKHKEEKHKTSKVDKNYLINCYGETRKRLYSVEKFLRHFERFNTEDTYNALRTKATEEENPFWLTARQWLTKEEYKLLKEKVYGKGRSPLKSKYSRGNGFRRFSRTDESD